MVQSRLKRFLLQFLLLIIFYFISRCIFTAINLKEFEDVTYTGFLKVAFYALRFDISAILSVNSFYIFLLFIPFRPLRLLWWERANQVIFIFLNSLAFLFEFADWAYFPYNKKRATADILDLISRKADFLNLLPGLLVDFWFVPVGAMLMLFAFIKINNKIVLLTSPKPDEKNNFWKSVFIFVCVAIVSIIGIRGGMQYVPIGIRNVGECVDSKYAAIVLNTPFSIISSFQNARLEEEVYYDRETLKKYLNTTKNYSEQDFKKKNVVVVILESFSKEFTGIGGMKSYTPFLDSLMKQSLVCTNAFANGNRSADGIPAILAGIPTLQEEPFTTNIYGANAITSMANLLSKKGYSSAFYHGGSNGTMGFDLFARNAGFQHFKGRNEYPDKTDYDGHWGIWDEPFLQYAVDDISASLKEPFLASVFTLSSHQPYKIPEKYKGIFPKGDLEIHETIGYADFALRRFFASAKMQPWYNNTLFIVVADHCSPLSNDDYYHYHQGRFAIPIVYFSPGDTSLKGTNEYLTQQIDILPSVMDYLDFTDSFFAFGNSVFSEAQYRYTVQHWNGEILWTMDNYFLHAWGKNPDGFYDAINDKLNKTNLLNSKDSLAKQHFDYLRAFRQSYNDAMIHNKLKLK